MDKKFMTEHIEAIADRNDKARTEIRKNQEALAREEFLKQAQQRKLRIKNKKIKVLKKRIVGVTLGVAMATVLISNAVTEIKCHIGSKYAYETLVNEGLFPKKFKAYESDIHETVVVEYIGPDGEMVERPLKDIGALIGDMGADVIEEGHGEIYSSALVGAGFTEAVVEDNLRISAEELEEAQLNCYNMMQQLDKGMGRSN